MKKTHYLISRGNFSTPKNNLQEEVMDYLATLEGTLIDIKDILKMQSVIESKFAELNAKYKRCRPISARFEERRYKERIYLSGFEQVEFFFSPATLIQL
ncbi:MAG: hypothetical protein BGO88_04740 [Flavobacterium sp. 38-13]|uniref:hypothetical protein n=1 Tax=Flavobacterium sp. 38-13 TaxID=1896168 RepID=UPI0009595E95|nr:hypothetical protein [Flavobacterium sp. 38-13]OJX55524.1 MAG: hypothetical protein BGO88_04740 [Flavobacterium sp. 38-13]